jgi:hypothetical protein
MFKISALAANVRSADKIGHVREGHPPRLRHRRAPRQLTMQFEWVKIAASTLKK